MKAICQVDFTEISAQPKKDEGSLSAVLSFFDSATSELDERFSINALSGSIPEPESETGEVGAEITFDLEDFDDEFEDEDDDSDDDSEEEISEDEKTEKRASAILQNYLEDICEKNDMQFDITDITV